MATKGKGPKPRLADLLNGMLTLLEWQQQLVLEALGRLQDRPPTAGGSGKQAGRRGKVSDPGKRKT